MPVLFHEPIGMGLQKIQQSLDEQGQPFASYQMSHQPDLFRTRYKEMGKRRHLPLDAYRP